MHPTATSKSSPPLSKHPEAALVSVMPYENEEWEIVQESACIASAQAAQENLTNGRLLKALGHIGDCIGTYASRWSSNKDIEPTSLGTKLDESDTDLLRPYSVTTAGILYDVFHGTIDLPCQCQRPEESLKISQHHIITLGLGTLKTAGDKTHRYFDSLITLDETHQWTCVQFRLPASEKSVGMVMKSVSFDDSIPEDMPLRLEDFCQLARERISMYRNPILLHKSPSELLWYEPTQIPMENFPANRGPITVTEALERDLLSAESKVYLAFAISKYFWQFYDSKWMHVDWNLDDALLLLPQRDDFQDLNAEAKVPYLAIRPAQPPLNNKEYDTNLLDTGARRMHQHPFILKLCLLLVLLGTENGSMDEHTVDSNLIHVFCVRKISHKETKWPNLTSLKSEINERYRRIVSKCLPTKPRSQMRGNVEERRNLLKDDIVDPLQDLLHGMKSPGAQKSAGKIRPVKIPRPTQTNNIDRTDVICSRYSEAWLQNLTSSALHRSLKLAYRKIVKRPMIALIDTGYDPKAFVNNSRKQRFGNGHWKDFSHDCRDPLDEDGHGTSMLDLLWKVAPFADICIARIAKSSQELGDSGAQKRLAQAIEWATEDQHADVVSLSLGWQYGETTQECWVANAIHRAMHVRNQKLLFFASASNYGAGTRELFPARHPSVFSIRATDHFGAHQTFNPSLPEDVGSCVYGTLGVGVPTLRTGGIQKPIARTGTSPATAIAAGIAALVIAYINTWDHSRSWDEIRSQAGYQRLLQRLSTEPEARKRFITLEEVYGDSSALGKMLNKVA